MTGNGNSRSAAIVDMASRIRAQCSIITKVARADLETRLKDHDSGITAIEHGLLRHLACGVTSMAEISRLMGVAPSTLVYVVDALVKKKLISRGKDPRDRRREPLVLEKKGAGLFAGIPTMESSSVLVKSLESMPEPRRRELLLLLNEFAAGLPGADCLYLRTESGEAESPRRRHQSAARAGIGRKS